MGKLPWLALHFQQFVLTLLNYLVHRQMDIGRYILTLSARFPEVVALKDVTTSTAAEALFEIFSRAGFAEGAFRSRISIYLRHDQRNLQFFFSQSTISLHHAMGNGIIENFNKSLKNLLKKIASEKPKDWHRYLGH